MNKFVLAVAAVAMLGLGACGTSRSDRALSGAGLGAAAGTGVSALTGGSLVGGAVIGGAAGALGGGLTSSSDVNLGKPIWR